MRFSAIRKLVAWVLLITGGAVPTHASAEICSMTSMLRSLLAKPKAAASAAESPTIAQVKRGEAYILTEGPVGQAARDYLMAKKIPFTTSYTTKIPEYAESYLQKFSPKASRLAKSKLQNYFQNFHTGANRVFVSTSSLADELAAQGLDPDRMAIWSRGVDTEMFHPAKRNSALFKAQAIPISIYSGRLAQEKNVEDFLKLDIPGTKVVVGEGPLLAQLQKKYPQVIFTGKLSQPMLAEHLASSDIYVFPSVTDTFGQAQLEANAAGLPVVAYRVPGPVDVISETKSGALAKYSVDEPGKNLAELKNAWASASKISHESARAWAEKWTWKEGTDQFMSQLEHIPRKPSFEFKRNVSEEFVTAEQALSGSTPLLSHPVKVLVKVSGDLGLNGNLSEYYRPSSEHVFRLKTVLVPAEEFPVFMNSAALTKTESEFLFYEAPTGKKYVRYFMHPDGVAHEIHAKGVIADHKEWWATPQGSGRSLIVKEINNETPDFMIKSSIFKNDRFHRNISQLRAIRSAKISEDFERIHQSTGGLLKDSNKSWDFFREPFSASSGGISSEQAGFIYRRIPPSVKDDIVIPWFSLVAERPGKERWIDELYRASGAPSMDQFLWNDLVSPSVELHSLISVKNGLTSELHQQNLLVHIDRVTKKVKGFLVRDMDAHFVDAPLRRSLGLPKITYGDGANDLNLFEAHRAQELLFSSYTDKLRMESLEWILKYAVSEAELLKLLKKADARFVHYFEETFPQKSVSNLGEAETAWEKYRETITTAKEAEAFDKIRIQYKTSLKTKVIEKLKAAGSHRGLK